MTRAVPYQLRFQLFNSLFKVGELNNVKQQTGQRCSNPAAVRKAILRDRRSEIACASTIRTSLTLSFSDNGASLCFQESGVQRGNG